VGKLTKDSPKQFLQESLVQIKIGEPKQFLQESLVQIKIGEPKHHKTTKNKPIKNHSSIDCKI